MPLRPWLLVQPPPRRAEANQEPRQHEHWQGGLDLYRYAAARRQHVNESAEQEAAGDTADPDDPAFSSNRSTVDNPMSNPPMSPLIRVKPSNTVSFRASALYVPAAALTPCSSRAPRRAQVLVAPFLFWMPTKCTRSSGAKLVSGLLGFCPPRTECLAPCSAPRGCRTRRRPRGPGAIPNEHAGGERDGLAGWARPCPPAPPRSG